MACNRRQRKRSNKSFWVDWRFELLSRSRRAASKPQCKLSRSARWCVNVTHLSPSTTVSRDRRAPKKAIYVPSRASSAQSVQILFTLVRRPSRNVDKRWYKSWLRADFRMWFKYTTFIQVNIMRLVRIGAFETQLTWNKKYTYNEMPAHVTNSSNKWSM